MSVQVPQQQNSYDCGIFVLHFARIFLCDPEFYTAFFLVGGIFPVHLSLSLREEFLDYIVCNELSS